jgi:hypothetical protein
VSLIKRYVARIVRKREDNGRKYKTVTVKTAVAAFGITSLDAHEADSEHLAVCVRNQIPQVSPSDSSEQHVHSRGWGLNFQAEQPHHDGRIRGHCGNHARVPHIDGHMIRSCQGILFLVAAAVIPTVITASSIAGGPEAQSGPGCNCRFSDSPQSRLW